MSPNNTYPSSPRTGSGYLMHLTQRRIQRQSGAETHGTRLQARLGVAGRLRCLAKRRLPNGVQAQGSITAPIRRILFPTLVTQGGGSSPGTPCQSVAQEVIRKKTGTDNRGGGLPGGVGAFSSKKTNFRLTSPESCRSHRACPARARAFLQTWLRRSDDRCRTSFLSHPSTYICRLA